MRPQASTKPPKTKLRSAAASQHAGWAERVIPAALLFITVCAFWRVCGCDFTNWDDYENVAQNPLLNPPTFEGILHFWANPHMAIYIPLTYTVWGTIALFARVSPDAFGISLNPLVFHAANLLVHLSAVLLTYLLLKQLTRNMLAAGVGAMLFALHPVQVESVAWVAGMKDVLCGALSIAALWQYTLFAQPTRQAEPERSDGARRTHYALATAAFILAMLAKPSGMVVPVLAIVPDRMLFGRSWRDIARALVPWLVLAFACAIAAAVFQPTSSPPDGGKIWARPLLAGAAVAFYLYKLVWPAALAVQYHYSPQVLLNEPWLRWAWLVPAAFVAVAWGLRRRKRWLLPAVLLFMVPVVPVSGLVPFQFERISLTADHYLYLAMLGPALAVAFLLCSLQRTRIAVAAIAAAIFLVLGARSYFQTLHWQDTATLFRHTLGVNPMSDVAYNNLATLALAEHRPTEAEALARESIRLRPEAPEAYGTLGNALYEEHRVDEGLAAYQRAHQLEPDNPNVLNSLAGALAQRGRIDDALPLCLRAIELDPLSAAARRNLSVMLAGKGRMSEALPQARAAVQLKPQNVEGQVNLGFLLAATGHREEAIAHVQEALRLDPNSAKAAGLMRMLTQPR